jgi:hypothetical protein
MNPEDQQERPENLGTSMIGRINDHHLRND